MAPAPTGVAFRPPPWPSTPNAVCPSTAVEAHAWLDGELAPRATARFGAHLDGCPPCRAHVAALRRFLTAVRRPPARPPVAPASLRLRVRDLVARWHAHDHTTHDNTTHEAAAGSPPLDDGREAVR